MASHVRDVAPENGSTTSRHAERNDVVDALRALQSIGDLAEWPLLHADRQCDRLGTGQLDRVPISYHLDRAQTAAPAHP